MTTTNRWITWIAVMALSCAVYANEQILFYEKNLPDGSRVEATQSYVEGEDLKKYKIVSGMKARRLEVVLRQTDGKTHVFGSVLSYGVPHQEPDQIRLLDAEVWGLGRALLVHEPSRGVYAYLFSSDGKGTCLTFTVVRCALSKTRQVRAAKLIPTANGAYLLFEYTDTTTDLWYWSPCSKGAVGQPSISSILLVWQGNESELMDGKMEPATQQPQPNSTPDKK
jgi:hypothetical protein